MRKLARNQPNVGSPDMSTKLSRKSMKDGSRRKSITSPQSEKIGAEQPAPQVMER